MDNMQKIGGISAVVNAAAYVVGIAIVFAFLAPVMDAEPKAYLALVKQYQGLLVLWHIIIYLVAGVFMVPLVMALYERLKGGAPALSQVAAAFGLVWVATIISSGMIMVNDLGVIAELYDKDPDRAETVWIALSAVEEGLGGAIELPGGLWMALVSVAALKLHKLPRLLNYFGILVGVAGVCTVVPAFYSLGYGFGLGAIVWFIGAGVVLFRKG